MRQIVLDTETTGLQVEEGHRIIEIGCIELINRKLTGRRYHQYINPERLIDDGALSVHGITQQFLSNKPIFSEIIEEFMQFIHGAELIIHNAPFDIGFLNYELKLAGQKWQALSETNCRIIDTLILARQLHVGQRNGLDALCKRYSIDNSQRELHGALLDAHLLAQVYLAMTGGQGSLFDELQSTTHAPLEVSEKVVVNIQKKNLRVLKANAEELSQHAKQLQKMREKGKCLWESEVSQTN
jgi:DNA polymerase-3 subunit epsilon